MSELESYRVQVPISEGVSPTQSFTDPVTLREATIPLPPKLQTEDTDSWGSAVRRVLLMGTFGSGKSSLMRHLLATAGESPGFPAVSAGRTTIAPTEVICSPERSYAGVVTFAPEPEIREVVRENVSAASRQALRGSSDKKIADALLIHTDLRVRLTYLFGKYVDIEARRESRRPWSAERIDAQISKQSHIQGFVDAVRRIADQVSGFELRTVGSDDEDDEARGLDEVIEDSTEFAELVDTMMSSVRQRTLDIDHRGTIDRDPSGWPVRWYHTSTGRSDFLEALDVFTGNADAKLGRLHRLGQLMTPLVNGVRIRGPFKPDFADDVIPLVILDTQGLGHVIDGHESKSTSIPNEMVRWMREADAIILVDSGQQPMHNDPPLVLRTVATMGATRRFFLVFSHMDQVRGGPIATEDDAAEHVDQAVRAALEAMAAVVGPRPEELMRSRLSSHSVYASHLNELLDPENPQHEWTIEQLADLTNEIAAIPPNPPPPEIVPIYARAQIRDAVTLAGSRLNAEWAEMVGIWKGGTRHWATVRALAVRMAFYEYLEGWNGMYPAADLRSELQAALDTMLREPADWQGEPTIEERQAHTDDLVAAVQDQASVRLAELAKHRVIDAQRVRWRKAATFRGTGSTRERAAVIREIMNDSVIGHPGDGVDHIAERVADLLTSLSRADGTALLRVR
jgi:predicted GTPase